MLFFDKKRANEMYAMLEKFIAHSIRLSQKNAVIEMRC